MPHPEIRRYLKHGTLTQLRAFEACVRLGSGTRAAEELHMAQPTASVLLKKLGETVGLALFEQVGKRVVLTEAGERVYACCNDVFRALQDLERSLGASRGTACGQLRLSVAPAVQYFAARLLEAFAQHNPRVQASLQVHERAVMTKRMCTRDDDLYLLAEPGDGLQVVGQAIVPNPLVVLASGDHPLAGEKAISFACLASEPLLLREPGAGTRLALLRIFARHGVAPKIRAEFSSDAAIREAVLAGLGVSVLPRHAPGLDPALSQLVCLPVEGFPLESHWTAVYPIGRRPGAAARFFLDFARTEAKAVFRECLRGQPSATAV